jgi:hypothetical protein
MSSKISVAALLLLFATGRAAREVPAAALPLPEAVLAHPAPEKDPFLQPVPWRRSAEEFATWKGPWVASPGLYDHRYVTW